MLSATLVLLSSHLSFVHLNLINNIETVTDDVDDDDVYRCCLEKKTLSSHQCNLVQNKITISSFGRPCSMFIDILYMFLKSSVLSGI